MIRRLAYPALTLVVIVAAWQAACIFFRIPAFILPLPGAVWDALVDSVTSGEIWPHLVYTLESTLIGFAISAVLGIALGALLAESAIFERFVAPVLAALQAVPKVALAPLILVWCGFGLESKIVLVVLVCFFPLFVNTLSGIRQADPDMIAMARSFFASRAYVFFHVKLPAAAGAIFAGLQIGISLALIGAIVGEFVSAQRGLGFWIASATVNMAVSTMFAGVIVLAVLGIIGTELVKLAQRHVVFWENRDPGTAPSRRGNPAP
jgi:NitT/TauT family transport system permease protein